MTDPIRAQLDDLFPTLGAQLRYYCALRAVLDLSWEMNQDAERIRRVIAERLGVTDV